MMLVTYVVQVTEERMKLYFMTQPFMHKGFVLVVNSGGENIYLSNDTVISGLGARQLGLGSRV